MLLHLYRCLFKCIFFSRGVEFVSTHLAFGTVRPGFVIVVFCIVSQVVYFIDARTAALQVQVVRSSSTYNNGLELMLASAAPVHPEGSEV